jgi:hypothetical protein
MVMETGCLVGGLEHGFYDFPDIYIFIIPTDELIFFVTFFSEGRLNHQPVMI